ncbi:Phosphoserine aminotransferase-like [Oopsacas minuta]|uniref:phosphoserine transaminase n=1 Tax=Oopsacas minuta TaxID=111878 RepID=A0AAV7K9Q4_9METZ|nr:Phosphoserine aminotransferase-like [Oopsacas minuta]
MNSVYKYYGCFKYLCVVFLVKVNRVFPPLDTYNTVPDFDKWTLDPEASYVYYCANETVHGVEFNDIPDTKGVPIVADMSSNILTRRVDISKYGVIYAGAQKNMGCSGVTLVIIREDLLASPSPLCPTFMEYKTQAANQSIYNTPPVWNIYVMGEVFRWVQNSGGVPAMEKMSEKKSKIIYEVIDNSKGFYWNPVDKKSRSRINVPVRMTGPDGNQEIEALFLQQAEAKGMLSLKGHRSVGGLRISLFNAISVEDTITLRDFMIQFREDQLDITN